MKRRIKKIVKNSVMYKPLARVCHFFYYAFFPFGYVSQYVVFPVKAFFRKHRIKPFYNKELQHIDKFYNKYAGTGKRCFIVATGPSLTLEDIKKLDKNHEFTISMNGIYKFFDRTDWRPDVYAALDPNVEINARGDKAFAPGTFSKEISFLNAKFLRGGGYVGTYLLHSCWQNHWMKVGDVKYDHSKNLRWNTDIVYGIFDKYTITNVAIEIAIFMGFREIYLIGVDNDYRGSRPYCYSDMGNEVENQPDKREEGAHASYVAMTQAYEFMAKETKAHGIHVYNATRGGRLEAFERVDFDTLF